MVSVKGYLRFGDDGRNLWTSEESYTYVRKNYVPPDNPAWSRCIALYDIDGWRKALLSMNTNTCWSRVSSIAIPHRMEMSQ